MRRRHRHIAPAGDEAAAVRFAWCAAFFATLTLVAVLGLAKSAQALTIPPSGSPAALAAPPSDDEAEGEAEAGEDEELELEECEEDDEECEEEVGPGEAPRECLLTSALVSVATSANRDQVRLQVRYTASAPTAVSLSYGLHGSKGSLYLGDERKHLARQGVLRLTKSLTATQMIKATAAKGYLVRLRVPAAPGYCQPFFDYQLDVRQATPSGLSWRPSE
jgi:hypothetical protein